MRTGIIVLALLAAAATTAEAQIRVGTSRPSGDNTRTTERRPVYSTSRNTNSCAVDMRELGRQRAELEQRLRREHQEWHRVHNEDRNYVRAHNAQHDRLERVRDDWRRRHQATLNRCGDYRDDDRWEDRRDHRDYDDDSDSDRRYNKAERKYDKGLEKLAEQRQKLEAKRDSRLRRSDGR